MARAIVPSVLVGSALVRPAGASTIWQVGKPQGHVEIREDLPSPREFYDEYVRNAGGPFEGFGKPALFKGAAAGMPAFRLWTDEYLRRRHGKAAMDMVETEKKETRTKIPRENMRLEEFLDLYNSSEIYSVAKMPEGLADEVFLLPPMNCGGFDRRLAQTVLWMSSGGTKSVIHSDGQQNWHCAIAGKKDFIFWHPKTPVATRKLGWVRDAEKEAEKDPALKDAYGAFAARVDVDNVDLERFPGWMELEWWNMTLGPGDCVFIPSAWYHFVEAPARQRSISFHVWFFEETTFDQSSCDALAKGGIDAAEYLVRLSDCTWGYEREDKKAKLTKCRTKKRKRPTGPADEL